MALAAGCGGQARRPEPRLAQGDAQQLVTLARQVARDAPTDGCAAQREIAALSAKAHELVAAGRVPVRLRAHLLGGVAALAAAVPACAPAPAPTPAPAAATTAPAEKHDHGKHNGDKRHHGHGHDDDDQD